MMMSNMNQGMSSAFDRRGKHNLSVEYFAYYVYHLKQCYVLKTIDKKTKETLTPLIYAS